MHASRSVENVRDLRGQPGVIISAGTHTVSARDIPGSIVASSADRLADQALPGTTRDRPGAAIGMAGALRLMLRSLDCIGEAERGHIHGLTVGAVALVPSRAAGAKGGPERGDDRTSGQAASV